MGKYIRRKSKTSNLNEASLMELPSLAGVLTRAKSLALQKAAAASSYIQLRSRRLVKPISPTNPNKLRALNSSNLKVKSLDSAVLVKKLVDVNLPIHDHDNQQGSFGENILEIEARERTTRETTPCSLIRDPDVIKTPGSSTKPTRSIDAKYRVEPRPIPSTSEMDEFFTGPEKQQQQLFIDKYNFDPVNDKPLHGHYEWVKLDATKKS